MNGLGPGRDLETPSAFCHPDHVANPTQNALCPGSIAYIPCPEEPDDGNDNGGVHTNSGIPNKTTQLMTDGGLAKGIQVAAMGLAKTRRIKYEALLALPSCAGFQEARDFELGTVQSWNGLNGWTAFDACTVRNAWAAVGKGVNDFNCDGLADGLLDFDNDFVPDFDPATFAPIDNCPNVSNPDQQDSDFNGIGDACDDDLDGDGFPNDVDTCPTFYNPDQGGPCDDFDSDGVLNEDDNCIFVWNPDQTDSDGDGIQGDACEVDTDGDGENNDTDNCPFLGNPGQADGDGDGYGDACDKCPDAADPVIAFTPVDEQLGELLGETQGGTPYQPDSDGDGDPDTCDPTLMYLGKPLQFRELRPGGKKTIELRAAAVDSSHVRTEIEPCEGACPEWFAPSYGVELELRGLDPEIRVWISDDQGQSVAQARSARELRRLRFQPVGGRRYFFNLSLSPRFRLPATRFELGMSRWTAPAGSEERLPDGRTEPLPEQGGRR